MVRGFTILTVLLLAEAALCQIPEWTRKDILNYGATGIGSPYVWGGSNWDPSDRSFGGADCSGFVGKSWALTRWTPYRVSLHAYATIHYIGTPGAYWEEVNRGDMLYGDAIVYRYADNSGGHTYLYLAGDGWGSHEVYEARGTAYGIVHRWREVISDPSSAKGIRRDNLIENISVTEHIVETDDGAPTFTAIGMTGSSQYDSYALGCEEGNCRYRWVSSTRNESCTFRPVIPETAYYRVYVTCNEGDENVSGVRVTINHGEGTNSYTWDQDDDSLHNKWTPMGDRGFLFYAGSDGSVVWDDYNATPANGTRIFRGDATKFSIDNRVEVDGVGGSPGKFATLRDAVAWINAHQSEEPDIINITCDTLTETGCVEIDLDDDLVINGDADGNGTAVVIAVSPSTPSDWSQPCGMYLDIPIQHHYEINDVVVVPRFVSAGHSTGAYGLVIDERNPGGDACAMSLSLSNVTVTGSLNEDVPTDSQVDSRALATMFGGNDSDLGAAVLQRSSDWAGDDACRQAVFATGLTITHSATRGLALTSSYTSWVIDGGLNVTCNTLEGIKAHELNESTLRIVDSSGMNPNRITGNFGSGLVNTGEDGTGYVELSRCRISENHGTMGGGITSEYATTIIDNCFIVDNYTAGGGGGVLVVEGNLHLSESTVSGNSAANGVGGLHSWLGNIDIANSIIWGNEGISFNDPSATVNYCDVEGGYSGVGNIDVDPVFISASTGDYHLARYSPCLNGGNPAFVPVAGEVDWDGQLRVFCGLIDMGADEQQFCGGDANCDGNVDIDDFINLADCLSGPNRVPSQSGCLEQFDYDDDNDIDLVDFSRFEFR